MQFLTLCSGHITTSAKMKLNCRVLVLIACALIAVVSCDDNHEGEGCHDAADNTLEDLTHAVEQCVARNVLYPMSELRGLNDTEAIRQVILTHCNRSIHEIQACGDSVKPRAQCLTPEERQRLRLSVLYKETIFRVGCKDGAAIQMNIRLAKLRMPPSDNDDDATKCFHLIKESGASGGGVNQGMMEEMKYFKVILECLRNSHTPGHEEAVNAGIAMVNGVLDHVVCVNPADGSDVLCKTLVNHEE